LVVGGVKISVFLELSGCLAVRLLLLAKTRGKGRKKGRKKQSKIQETREDKAEMVVRCPLPSQS